MPMTPHPLSHDDDALKCGDHDNYDYGDDDDRMLLLFWHEPPDDMTIAWE